MTSSLAGLNLWSLWSGATDWRTSRLFAAAVPIGYWAPFFVAPLVRGTGVDDPPHPDRQGRGGTDQPAGRGGHHLHRRRLAAGSTEPLIAHSLSTSPMV